MLYDTRVMVQPIASDNEADDVGAPVTSFCTGKELDPDFVDFNSQNFRYHFPARFYLPNRALFGQVDPLVLDGGRRRMRKPLKNYLYVNATPTQAVDPVGLDDCLYVVTSIGADAAIAAGPFGLNIAGDVVIAATARGYCVGLAIGAGFSMGLGAYGGVGFTMGFMFEDCCPTKLLGKSSYDLEFAFVAASPLGGVEGELAVGIDGIGGEAGGGSVKPGGKFAAGGGVIGSVRVMKTTWLFCVGDCTDEAPCPCCYQYSCMTPVAPAGGGQTPNFIPITQPCGHPAGSYGSGSGSTYCTDPKFLHRGRC
jgi:hypothetical protein